MGIYFSWNGFSNFLSEENEEKWVYCKLNSHQLILFIFICKSRYNNVELFFVNLKCTFVCFEVHTIMFFCVKKFLSFTTIILGKLRSLKFFHKLALHFEK